MDTLWAILGVILLFVCLSYFVTRTVVRRKVCCPRTGADANVEVLNRGFCGEGESLKVKSCDLLPDPKKVDCEEECIRPSAVTSGAVADAKK